MGSRGETGESENYNVVIAYLLKEYGLKIDDVLMMTYKQLSGIFDSTVNYEDEEKEVPHEVDENGDMVFENDADLMAFLSQRGLML